MNSKQFTDNEKKILDLDIRRNVYMLVNQFAGCHFREIERKCNLPTGTLRYHLNFLVKNHLLTEKKDGNTIRFFPKGFKSNKEVLGLLRQKSIRKIILYIITHENCNHEEIVKAVNLAPSTISWHIKKLEEHKIIGYERDGRKTRYHILIDQNEIIRLLIAYQESFLDTLVNNVIDMWEM